jgi:tol-pal system protein YbgF
MLFGLKGSRPLMTGVLLRILASVALVCAAAAFTASAQDSDVILRLNQLEQQMRQLTGAIEQLQYRNQQLEQALRRMQEDVEFRNQQGNTKGPATQVRPTGAATQTPGGGAPQTNASGRKSDAFDPTLNPNAPGVPHTLGSMPGNTSGNAAPQLNSAESGAPLDLSTLPRSARGEASSGDVTTSDGTLAPPSRNPNGIGGQTAAVLPPSQSPRDQYDLAYGYLLRKDYALAEEGFRTFLRSYPADRMAADAQFWLGESMFQRQSYRDAADAFLNVTKKYESSVKAPDALLRLGQSLEALGEKDLACATLGEVGRKYPRASLNVKQGVDREQKRVHC